MSDAIKHECGIALVRLLKPLDFYKEKYGSSFYGINKMYLMMEKQHNRGQDGTGIGCVTGSIPASRQYFATVGKRVRIASPNAWRVSRKTFRPALIWR